jgi:NhaP-type Na+/H+ or K+/H+ antiporter
MCKRRVASTSLAIGRAVIGAILITMTRWARLASASKPGHHYLTIGYALGPAGCAVMTPDPLLYSTDLERMAEMALLISLFAVGLKLGVPLRDKRWLLPLRLAFPSMVLTVMLITAGGVLLLGLPMGAAILLGAILAPTDPVLASDVQVEDSSDRDRLRFSLTAEGGINDGAAFPLVILALGVLGLHNFGGGGWRWLAVDVLWAIGEGCDRGVRALIAKWFSICVHGIRRRSVSTSSWRWG